MHVSLDYCREKRMFHLDTLNSRFCLQKLRSPKNILLQNETLTGMKRFLLLNIPGAPLTYFNDGGVRQRFIFYTPKNPNFRICLPQKIPTFFSIPQKNPSVFLHQQILLFIFWKAKTCQLQLWFWSKTKL